MASTNTNSVWEQKFRQPTDSDILASLTQVEQRVAQASAQATTANQRNDTQDQQIQTKAPTNNPTLTGTVTVPTPPQGGGSLAVNQDWVRTAHASGTFTSGNAQLLTNGAWNVVTVQGSLAHTQGGIQLGAGGQGLFLPTNGLYLMSVGGYFTFNAAQLARVIVGLSLNGSAPTVAGNEVLSASANTSASGDSFFHTTLMFLGSGQLRPCLFAQNAPGQVNARIDNMSVFRVG